MLFAILLAFWGSASPETLPPSRIQEEPRGGLSVITAEFGTIGRMRKLDVAQRLQQLCGTAGDECEVFCSETSFGLYRLGRKPICRVAYRCPDGRTRSAEAAREELIVLRCREEDPVEPGVEASAQAD